MPKPPVISDELVRKYLLYCFEQGMDWQTVNADYSAIQKWFKNVLFVEWRLTKLPRPKREKKLPSVLSRQDVAAIIQSAKNYKHQVCLPWSMQQGLGLVKP
jgi:integrase/recombinase XerD